MKKLFILISAIIFHVSYSYGQRSDHLPMLSIGNVKDIQAYFQKYFKLSANFESDSCAKLMIYAKFKITADGRIDSLDISKNGPAEIKQALKTVVMATSGSWKFNNAERQLLNDKFFLLPLYCFYESGCSPSLVKKNAEKPKTLDGLLSKMEQQSLLATSVINMAVFEKGTYKSLNCILIAPVTAGVLQ